ncbi:hypothetical protein AAG570_010741 [Ranatra chinensis]|uniref:Uncharacterized protein n=1 Tax=Ranatra chinensis TaxID=642074 RepID=A0ABD0YNF0_9HEMI
MAFKRRNILDREVVVGVCYLGVMADSPFETDASTIWIALQFEGMKDGFYRTSPMMMSRAFKICLNSTAFVVLLVPACQYAAAASYGDQAAAAATFLPFPMHLPSDTFYVYLAAYLYEASFTITSTFLGTFLIEFYASLTQHICMHFTALSNLIQSLESDESDEVSKNMKIKYCVRYHLYIYR